MPFFGNKRRDFSIQPPRQQVDGTPFFVTDSSNIDFTLENLNLTADLTLTGVAAGTYGNATHIPILQIDQWGRVTGVTTTTFSASGILLQTDGIDNISQTILNLTSGTDIEVVDLGGGEIQFNYIGTGGTAAWGSIATGTGVASQTDLVSYLSANYYPLTGNPSGFITSAALANYVPNTRTLTINGITYDLSANRSWTISTGTGTVISVSAGTGMNFSTITASGSVDIDITKVPYLPAGFSTGLLKWDGSAWVFDNNTYLTTISGITAGGDLSGTYPDPTVAKLRGQPITTTTPTIGKILQYNGTEWALANIPTGGSGGGGVFYYFNYQNYTNISPTTGLPTTPVPPSQLGIIYDAISNSINSGPLTQGVYTLVCGFVTIVGTPGITTIPAGLWDFNIWADVVGATGGSNQTQFQIRVYKYNGSTAPTLLTSSDDIFIYDPTVIAQYIGNVTMPQTTLLVTDRIYIEFWAQKNVNQPREISFHFGTNTPSHVHTTIPSVTGTGLVKVVNSVYQSPATLLFNADVDAAAAIAYSKLNLTDSIVNADISTSAAIAVSKLSMSTNRLLGRITASTGPVEELTVNKSVKIVTGNVELDGDVASPGNDKVYGTNASGTKGWYDAATGGGNSIGQLTSPGDVTTPAATAPSQGVTATLDPNYKKGSCGVVFDGQGGTISNGKIAYVQVPYKGEITAGQIVANASGSCTITVRKGTFSPFPPTTIILTAALSGSQTAPITISPVIPVAAGDWISFTISGVLTVSWVNLTLSITKTL